MSLVAALEAKSEHHLAQAILRALEWRHSKGRRPPEHWYTTLMDGPRPGEVREELRAAVAAVLEAD